MMDWTQWGVDIDLIGAVMFLILVLVVWSLNRAVDRLDRTNRLIREELHALEDAMRQDTCAQLAVLNEMRKKEAAE